MKPFSAPLADILFSLTDAADAGSIPGWDSELTGDILTHFADFAENQIAPLNAIADSHGTQLIEGRVVTPDGFKQAYLAYIEQGWAGLGVAEEFGGQGASVPVLGAVSEIFTGACHALQMLLGLAPGAVRLLTAFGTPEQQQAYIPKLAAGTWLATMAMTEANAGSDLSNIATRATFDGIDWRISGEKIFISGGDQDMSEHILHLVLARTDPSPVKGLSLFLVASADEAGQRNAITVPRIEEKMGLHGSPTCQLVFENAKAELVGPRGQGLKVMFTMMNHARLDVAQQGVAHAARAADIARTYARERAQGGVTIDQHADVARMLTEQSALTIGARTMCHIALVELAKSEEGEQSPLVDFLTPVCKCFASDAGIKSADLGIQILGGFGYLKEYLVEQVLRDARITSIYEGTNGIHARTLVTRLLTLDNGAAASAFEHLIANSTDTNPALKSCLETWQAARKCLVQANDPTPHAHAFMKLTGAIFYLHAWTKIAEKLDAAPDPNRYRELNSYVQRTIPIETAYWAALISDQ